ncbi:cation-translocating P-type ATPase [Frankia sp. R43]|uniref:heavy metal translocating P-type ATPase n=1 Tax=Frankia sp. R43 TaxID=269536 RepID=UPI0006C9FBE0|nr:heavy metal translocating P-type ATPase [Frankia sp. R43]
MSTPTAHDISEAGSASSGAMAAPLPRAPQAGPAATGPRVELAVSGMTCAACARRVEKVLNRVEGASAVVNLATHRAAVTWADAASADDTALVSAVERAGYEARVITPRRPPAAPAADMPAAIPEFVAAPAMSGPAQDSAGVRGSVVAASVDRAPGDPGDAGSSDDPDHPVSEQSGGRQPGTGPGQPGGEPRDPGQDEAERWRRRALVVAAPTVVVVAAAMVPGVPDLPGWLTLLVAGPVVLWGAWPFHRAAWKSLRHHATRMDTLVSLGVLVSFGWAVAVTLADALGGPTSGTLPAGNVHGLGSHHHSTAGPVGGTAGAEHAGHATHAAEIACVLTLSLLVGRWMEARARRGTGSALADLAALAAHDATVLLPDGSQRPRPAADLLVGDQVLVRPGERIPADGVVVDGTSTVDLSLLTGESIPVDVTAGTEVTGGSVNGTGALVVRATRVGADTALAHITRLVQDAQTGRAAAQRHADRLSAVFVPAVLLIAAATAAGWLVSGAATSTAVEAAISVLLVACPCALGLATPAALLAGTGRGAHLGILISGPAALEAAHRIDTLVLDKTGTVTTGQITVTGITVTDITGPHDSGRDDGEAELLRRAAAVEQASEHPIARAVTAAAAARGLTVAAAQSFQAHPGAGATGTVNGEPVVVGTPALMEEHGLALPHPLQESLAQTETRGQTAVCVGWGGRARGILTLADPVRPTSRDAIHRLRATGLRVVLLTGDNPHAARTVANTVGVDEVIAGVSPAGKLDHIRHLRDSGHGVAMIGDGVNDAAALAEADLGIAMGSGADAAIHASDITLVRPDLHTAADALALAARVERTIRQNLAWAFGYNIVMIPLAAAGILPTWAAGAAMACSSLAVLGNSLRLRCFSPATHDGRHPSGTPSTGTPTSVDPISALGQEGFSPCSPRLMSTAPAPHRRITDASYRQ